MGLRIERCLGTVYDPQPRQWTDRTASEQPTIRCPECGAVVDLDRNLYGVSENGTVAPRWQCGTATCSFRDWIVLEAFGEEILY